ncbi:MAG: elongation factor G [Gammaproteobacteria bacterium]|nr:elongation factor G [Gammaproteobacteria bacterium]
MSKRTDGIHSLALVGSAGAGKTTLGEALLFAAGAITTKGAIERKSTTLDHDPQAQEQQHSLSASIACFDYQARHIQLLDTPGYPDFLGHALAAVEAVETVGVVINAASGIDMTARRFLHLAETRGICRFIIINRMDAEGVDLLGLLEAIREEFGGECLALNLPAPGRDAVSDCYYRAEGQTEFASVEDAHSRIVDQIVEMDEELMSLYLDQGQELKPEQLHDAFEAALREGHLIPVCFTSARTGAGVAELLQLLVDLMPNPAEGNPPPFLRGEGEAAQPVRARNEPELHAIAHVFKIAFDPFVGKQAFLRLHQGTLRRDQKLLIGDGRQSFKLAHLYKPFGKDLREVESIGPGEIGVVVKVEEIHRDAILHDAHEEDYWHYQTLGFPAPLYGLAIAAKSKADEQKLAEVLHRLAEEDPCLQMEQNAVTRETVLKGLGELHLRLTLERMSSRHKLDVDTRPPRIAYRETLQAPAEGHYRHKKQTGGAGQFGEVFLKVEPLERGTGFEFVDAVVGGAIPGQYMSAVEKGIREAMASGVVAGFPVDDVRVIVYDGKYHSVDSKEVAFVTAAKKAFFDAALKARPVVLEPVVNLDVVAPDQAMGDITGDLSSRRARILGTDSQGGHALVIHGQAPLAELGGYSTRLKAMTGGEGSFSLELSHYEAVPPGVQQELAKHYAIRDEE